MSDRYAIACPLCEYPGSCEVDEETQKYRCNSCGAQGDVRDLLMGIGSEQKAGTGQRSVDSVEEELPNHA